MTLKERVEKLEQAVKMLERYINEIASVAAEANSHHIRY